MRCSPAEQSLIDLAGEIVEALEEEQSRSDTFAQRRKVIADVGSGHHGAHCFNGGGGGMRAAVSIGESEGGNPASFPLGLPPSGVPPLIWGMTIYLVGKLARAYKTAVEARVFEREVADADLVAAVTLGRSSGVSNGDGINQLSLGCGATLAWLGREGGQDHISARVGDGPEATNPAGTSVKAQGRGNASCEFGFGADNYTHFRSDRPASATVVGAGDAGGGGRFARSSTRSRSNGIRVSTSSPRERMLDRSAPCNLVGHPPRGHYTSPQDTRASRWNSYRTASSQNYTKGASAAGVGGQLVPGGSRVQEFGIVSPRTTPGTQSRDHHQQQLGDCSKSAAVALVEAAAFSAVKRSELHARKCRPASASAEGRSIGADTRGATGATDSQDNRLGYGCGDEKRTPFALALDVGGCGEDGRPRPHSARRSDEKVRYLVDGGGRVVGPPIQHRKEDGNVYWAGGNVDPAAEKMQRDAMYMRVHDAKSGGGRIASDDADDNIAKVIAIRMMSPARPARTASSRSGSGSKPRPHSAGAEERGMIDTRIWSSSVARPAVFRCRPRNRVRFEEASGHSPATHARAVPAFLERKTKELERLQAIERERIAAVKGRFTVRPVGTVRDGRENMEATVEAGVEDEDGVRSGQEGSASAAESTDAVSSAIEHLGGQNCDDHNSAMSTMERAGWGQESEFKFVEPGGFYVAGGGSSSPASPQTAARLFEGVSSVEDAEGLLPNAGEQAFFEAWKPKGYGDDLTRFD